MKLSMISVEDNWILKDQHTLTWTDLLLKLFPLWLHHWDLMVPWTLILLNSKQIWYHILVFILCWVHTLQSSQQKKLTTNNFQLLKSPILHSNQHQWWPNVTQDTVNTWHALCYIEVMLYQRMLMLQLLQLKQRELFNLLIGVQLVLKLVSIINRQLLYQEVIWQKLWEQFVWFQILQLLLKFSVD